MGTNLRAFVSDYEMIPNAGAGDKDIQRKSVKRRMRIIKQFNGFDYSGLKTLDIGDHNAFGRAMKLNHNTLPTDFNVCVLAPAENYDLIICAEVIEHVMNPQFLMQRVFQLLRPGGLCILTTPLPRFTHQGPRHFTEYRRPHPCFRSYSSYSAEGELI